MRPFPPFSASRSVAFGPRGARVAGLLRLACFLFGCVAGAVAADDETIITPGASRAASAPAGAGGSLSSMSLVLGVALAGAGGWMVWRNRRSQPVGREMRALAVDETRSLGNRQYLVVASYEGRKFLIGVCPGRIDLLSALDGSAPREKGRE